MTELGYALSSEEHLPNDLVRNARAAEEAGFTFALISDHFHPWVDSQGQSPFVWSVIGGIAQATERLRLGTGVTCPTIRTHPGIIAHAAATCGAMMPGRLPEEPVPIAVAASKPHAAELAGQLGDALITVAPDEEILQRYTQAGGTGPKYGQVTVCWAESEEQARKTAFEVWPNAGIKGDLSQELALPRHFEQAAQMVTEDDVAEKVVCGPDPERHLEQIRQYAEAGVDHVYIHQVGSDQEGFFRFYEREILPKI